MRRLRLPVPLLGNRPGASGSLVARLADHLPPDHVELARDSRFVERLRACVHPDLYAAQLDKGETGVAERLDVDSALVHFLDHGAIEGRRICALFNPGWYLEELDGRGIGIPDGVVPFFHWLTVGWQERLVPTPLFDEEFYRASHPGLSQQWLFLHYLTRGCYRSQWRPSPLGRHHLGADDPTALEQQRPLLLRELLHRADEYDLAESSWLEEGCVAALRTYRTLESPTMREMVAKAAAIEPLVDEVDRRTRPISCPPHRHPRLFLAEQAGTVQRSLEASRYDTMILVPRVGHGPADAVAGGLAQAWQAAGASERTLLVSTDDCQTTWGDGRPFGSVGAVDLATHTGGMDTEGAIALLLDVVRGVEAHRIVTIGSRLGWDLIARYGRQLASHAELGAVVLDLDGDTRAVGTVRESLGVLDWVVLDDALRRRLVDSYLLPEVSQRRLVPLSMLTRSGRLAGPEASGDLVARLAQVSRRGA